jgi:hypothetical protein
LQFNIKLKEQQCYLPVALSIIEMGEQRGKPKVEGTRRPNNNNKHRGGQGAQAAQKAAPFSAPTVGYEKAFFSFDQPDSAAKFEES